MSVPKALTDANLLSTGQIAKRLSVHRSTVWHWVNTGLLPSTKVGSHYGVKPADVRRLLKKYNLPNINPNSLPLKVGEWEAA